MSWLLLFTCSVFNIREIKLITDFRTYGETFKERQWCENKAQALNQTVWMTKQENEKCQWSCVVTGDERNLIVYGD